MSRSRKFQKERRSLARQERERVNCLCVRENILCWEYKDNTLKTFKSEESIQCSERIHITLNWKEILLDLRIIQPINKRPWTRNFGCTAIKNIVIKSNSYVSLHFTFLHLYVLSYLFPEIIESSWEKIIMSQFFFFFFFPALLSYTWHITCRKLAGYSPWGGKSQTWLSN